MVPQSVNPTWNRSTGRTDKVARIQECVGTSRDRPLALAVLQGTNGGMDSDQRRRAGRVVCDGGALEVEEVAEAVGCHGLGVALHAVTVDVVATSAQHFHVVLEVSRFSHVDVCHVADEDTSVGRGVSQNDAGVLHGEPRGL